MPLWFSTYIIIAVKKSLFAESQLKSYGGFKMSLMSVCYANDKDLLTEISTALAGHADAVKIISKETGHMILWQRANNRRKIT